MAVETGTTAQGTIVRLLNYGVLVRLEDGTQGLVHISEIDNNYVRDVADYFQVDDPVTVKVLAQGERGRVELSVKQALGEGQTLTPRQPSDAPREPRPQAEPGVRRESRASFDEKMGEFTRQSSERLGDLKRNIERKRGGKKLR